MMETRFPAVLCTVLLAAALATMGLPTMGLAQTPAGQAVTPEPGAASTVIETTVRRVVLDVVVTDAQGLPVRGLTRGDFQVTEDGRPQAIVAFDAVGFSAGMDYVPPVLPAEPAGTFIDLPTTPEKGPLYVLLYDLVNMDSPDQMNHPGDHGTQLFARQELVKFIQNAPEGARFAIFVRSDGLHLVQGFTSDKAVLYAAIDPHHPGAHIPAVFLSAANFGRGDRISALNTLHAIATYLEGLPGRKNLIWFSSQFPVSLFTSETDPINYQEETRKTLNLLAKDEIAVYPVDARGVPYGQSHAQLADSVHSDTITSPTEAGSASAGTTGNSGGGSSPSTTSAFVTGSSSVVDSYNTMDGIARETGGRAYYGDNRVASQLTLATDSGRVYYMLTYAPTNHDYNGKLRNIHVEVARKGDVLAYRRVYYGTEAPEPDVTANGDAVAVGVRPEAARVEGGKAEEAQPPVGDTLSADMEHGAPAVHDLIFVVQAHAVGAPAEGTPEEMAELATEPAYFKSRKKTAQVKPLAPIPLQKEVFDFNVPTRQFQGEASLDLELVAAAYDADGRMMNAFVRVAKKDLDEKPGAKKPALFFRVEQELEVPVGAASVRLAVRDATNDRIGAMEVNLPLAPEGAGR
jgi:VWFA-related protein